jgi:DNA processing protein
MQPSSENQTHFNYEPERYDWESTPDELACALELNTLSTFRTLFRWLRRKFRSFRSMMDARMDDLDVVPESSAYLKERFLEHRLLLTPGMEMSKLPPDVGIITYFDKKYPESLRELYTPPPVLYVRGDIEYNYSQSMSIVGSRTHSDYGRQMTEHFGYQLAGWGFTIISGGARGIDSLAHKAAINAGGRTIAVLGNGIDIIFPKENEKLFGKIIEKGAIVSEFPIGTVPEKFNFPMRNRLIAALGRGTLIVEAPDISGALITADLALQMGREIFAVPGRITDGRSRGTNKLIQDGAHIALDPSDIALRFGLTVIEGTVPDSGAIAEQLEGDESLVYEVIGLEAKDTDQIVREASLPAPRVLASLLMLRTKGLIRELAGSRFVKPVGIMNLKNEETIDPNC